MIADVGLVGYPNSGKSTFLARVSNAQPKIADYPFTTLVPNLGVVDLGDGRGFVIADIPGLIEGASSGVGLGYEFLRHIERCRVLIHMVDAPSVEGRDPIQDVYAINKELGTYDPRLLKLPQVIAANKTDCFSGTEEDTIITLMREEFEPKGLKVFPISAATGSGVPELLREVRHMLDENTSEPLVYAQEFNPDENMFEDEPYTVSKESDGVFVVEGPRIDKMLGYTNLDSEKGFAFFNRFLKETGILSQLEELGIKEGDTVKMYNLQFNYYK